LIDVPVNEDGSPVVGSVPRPAEVRLLSAAYHLEAAADELFTAAHEAGETWRAELRTTAKAMRMWAGKVREHAGRVGQ